MSSRPRIRSLKPECWKDEKPGRLSRDARLLWVVLITYADDEGRFNAMPAGIIGFGYMYDSDAPRKLQGWLEELAARGLVHLYEHDGVPYGVVPKFEAHQKINRKSPSLLPPPPGSSPDPAPEPPPENGYRKGSIPEKVRRDVAKREGGVPGEMAGATCHYCPTTGHIRWPRLANGKPGSWVQFIGLELDHVEAEFHGGLHAADNIVLACPRCNRSKGHGTVTEFRDRLSRD